MCQSGSWATNHLRKENPNELYSGRCGYCKAGFPGALVDPQTGEVISRQIRRGAFLEHFANRTPCLIGMEACGGAQHWARRLGEMGHQVRLMPGKAVKAFVIGNRNDVADARAIWSAVQQPCVRAVALKTETQQAVLALHRMRQQLVRFRTMQINGLRGLLTEYGEVMAVGRAALNRAMAGVLARLSERLPAMLVDTLHDLVDHIIGIRNSILIDARALVSKRKVTEAATMFI